MREGRAGKRWLANRALKTPTPPSAVAVLRLSILCAWWLKRPEFHESRACLNRWGAAVEFADADSAAAALSENRVSPDVIVVAQAFPGQFSHEAIDRLRRLAPLARVLGLMGSWCEGEMRSGSPWPATMRTYWHQWPVRCDRQLHRLATGQSCSWAFPLTATDEERLLADAGERSVRAGGLEWCIRSHSLAMADWLSAACRRRGLATIWQRDAAFGRVEGATAAIFDGTDLCDDECDALRRFVSRAAARAGDRAGSFPRIEDHDRALSAGASAVLSKPLLVEDLLAAVDRSITAKERSNSRRSSRGPTARGMCGELQPPSASR